MHTVTVGWGSTLSRFLGCVEKGRALHGMFFRLREGGGWEMRDKGESIVVFLSWELAWVLEM